MTTDKKAIAKPTKPSVEIAVERTETEIERIDSILENKLSGDVNAYRDLLIDTTVFGTWTQRQTALTRLERQVVPHDPDNKADVEAAEFIEAQLKRINADAIFKGMHWGTFYGMSVGEAMFGIEDGKVVLDNILVRDRAKFQYNPKRELLYTGNGTETVMPDRKFWTFSAGADTTDNPYGLGLAHFLFWPVLFKKSNIKFWLLGNEKMATSLPHVQYDPRASDAEAERRKALQAGVALKNGGAIATAIGTTVELLKGVSGTTDYETLCRYMDETIALVVLGQVMTSQAVGGQYKADVQDGVKDDIIKADADLLCASLNNSIVKWLCEWNFPNANPPKVWLMTQDEVDQQATSTTFANMAKLGYRPTKEHVEATLGGEWEEMPTQSMQTTDDEASDKVSGEASDKVSDGTDFAEHDTHTDPLSAQKSQLETELAPQQSDWIERIRAELDDVDSLEAMRERLNALADELSFDDYAQLFAQANLAVKLAGMQSINEESADDN